MPKQKTFGEGVVEAANDAGLQEETVEETVETEDAPPEVVEEKKPRRRRKKADEVVEEPVDDAPVEETQEERPAWMQRMHDELGFEDTDDSDPDALIERAIEFAAQKRKQAEELEAWRRQNESFVAYGQQHLATQKPEDKTEQKPERKRWQPPVAYPENVGRYIETDEETGSISWKSDTPAEVRAQAEQFIAWKTDIVEMMANRPDKFFGEFLPEYIKEQVKGEIEPFYEERTRQQQAQDYLDRFSQENAAWLYAIDPQTNRPTQQLSQIGQLVDERLQYHMERGYSAEDALRYAQYDAQVQTGQAPWVKQTQVEETRQAKRREHLRKPLNGASSLPKRNGSFTEGEKQNADLPFGQRVLQRRNLEGITAQPHELS